MDLLRLMRDRDIGTPPYRGMSRPVPAITGGHVPRMSRTCPVVGTPL